jgi:uncharacterized membrane protein SpoIIM required for sporulation
MNSSDNSEISFTGFFVAITIGLFVLLFVVYQIGFIVSANVIAVECERLGGFYVGKTTYICSAK